MNHSRRRRRLRIKSGKRRGVHNSFLFDDDRRADRRVVEKGLGHSLGKTDATMRCRIRRDVSLVHGVAASEKHGERHSGAVVMRPRRLGILANIDIRFHDIAEIVDVITKNRRDVIGALGEDSVLAGRRREPGFPGGDG